MNRCTVCGKEFDYVPAISRADNKSYVCRICSAIEALDAANITDPERKAVLSEIRKHETL